jgi:membrane-associated phospholipid phosphatase
LVGTRGLDQRIGLILLLLAGVGPLQAQVRPFPYALDDRDFVHFQAVFALAYLGYEMSGRMDSPTFDEIAELQPNDANGFDRAATGNWSLGWQDTSDLLRNTLVASMAVVSVAPPFVGHAWSDAATLSVMSVEVMSLVFGITKVTKALSHRPRPYLYNQELTVQERFEFASERGGWGYQSFFSGHSTSSFAAASFVSKVLGDMFGSSTWLNVVRGASFSAAALVAWGRAAGGVHFPTDVVLGVPVGIAIGYLVPALHRRAADSSLSVSVAPTSVRIRLNLGG